MKYAWLTSVLRFLFYKSPLIRREQTISFLGFAYNFFVSKLKIALFRIITKEKPSPWDRRVWHYFFHLNILFTLTLEQARVSILLILLSWAAIRLKRGTNPFKTPSHAPQSTAITISSTKKLLSRWPWSCLDTAAITQWPLAFCSIFVIW